MSFNKTVQIRSVVLALFIAGPLLAQQGEGEKDKVVFLKNNAVATAAADGSSIRQIVGDAEPKWEPSWSADGRRIAFRIGGSQQVDPKSHARIVVVDDQGDRQTIPVLSTEKDGTPVGGMRFVEGSGWHSRITVFARGSVGPRAIEYRVLQLSGRVETSYFGTQFTTCLAEGRVAYLSADTGETPTIEVNGSKVYSGKPPATISNMSWSVNCGRLLFVEARGPERAAVVIRNGSVEARLTLTGSNPIVVDPLGDSFLIAGTARPLRYNPASRSLDPAEALLAARTERERSRGAVVSRLEAQSPAWWPQRQ